MAPKKSSQTPATTSQGQASRGKAKIIVDETSSDSGSDEEYFPESYEADETQDNGNKKRKTPSSVVLQRFLNAEAQIKFCEFAIRHIHIERSFAITEKPYTDIIKFYNWQLLTMAPELCNVAVAKEFYANAAGADAKEVKSKGIFLRGKYLKLTSESVNKHYGLKDHLRDELTEITEAGNPETILRALSLPGTDWVRNQLGDPKYVLLKDLTAEAKTWLLFVNSRLMPTTHTTRISRDRLFLVYAIKNRFTINVGKFMVTYINHAIAEHGQAMYFPHFLLEQAVKQGVKVSGGEECRVPAAPVKDGQLKHYKSVEKADRKQREEEARERARAVPEPTMDNIDEDQDPNKPKPIPPQPATTSKF